MKALVYYSKDAIREDADSQIVNFLSYHPDTELVEVRENKTDESVGRLFERLERRGIQDVYFMDEAETLPDTENYLRESFPDFSIECVPESFGRMVEAQPAPQGTPQQSQAQTAQPQQNAQAATQQKAPAKEIAGFVISQNLPVKMAGAEIANALSATLQSVKKDKVLKPANALKAGQLQFMIPRVPVSGQFLDSGRLLTLLSDLTSDDVSGLFNKGSWKQLGTDFASSKFSDAVKYDIAVPSTYMGRDIFVELASHSNVTLYPYSSGFPKEGANTTALTIIDEIINDFTAKKIELKQEKPEIDDRDIAIASLIQMRIDFKNGKFKADDQVENIADAAKAYKDALAEFFKGDIDFANSVMDLYGLGIVRDVAKLGKNLANATAKLEKDELETAEGDENSDKYKAKDDRGKKEKDTKSEKAKKAQEEAKSKLIVAVTQHPKYKELFNLFY